MHSSWIDLQGQLISNYDPTQDKPVAFDLEGVNRQASQAWGEGVGRSAHFGWLKTSQQSQQTPVRVVRVERAAPASALHRRPPTAGLPALPTLETAPATCSHPPMLLPLADIPGWLPSVSLGPRSATGSGPRSSRQPCSTCC